DDHGQNVAGANLGVGRHCALGIDAHGAGFDDLLRQRARFDGAREEQPLVEALPALNHGCSQSSFRLAVAQGGQGCEGRIGIEDRFLARTLIGTAVVPVAAILLVGTLEILLAAMRLAVAAFAAGALVEARLAVAMRTLLALGAVVAARRALALGPA